MTSVSGQFACSSSPQLQNRSHHLTNLSALSFPGNTPKYITTLTACLIQAVFLCSLTGCLNNTTTPTPQTDPSQLDDWTTRYDMILSLIADRRTGFVKYHIATDKRETIKSLVDELATPRTFMSKNDRLASFLNAYNLLVIHNIIVHEKLISPKAIGGFYDYDRFTVFGKSYTLHKLFNTEIAPKDVRVHMAAVHGFVSGAHLRTQAYREKTLDAQLDAQTKRFINDRTRNTQVGGMLMLSSIFERYQNDFMNRKTSGLLHFLRKHADAQTPFGQVLKNEKNPKIMFVSENMSLNFIR